MLDAEQVELGPLPLMAAPRERARRVPSLSGLPQVDITQCGTMPELRQIREVKMANLPLLRNRPVGMGHTDQR